MGLYPFVVKLVSPNLLVLKLFHGFAQAVGLPCCVLSFEFSVLDEVMHSTLQSISLLLGVREGLGGAAKRILSPGFHPKVASLVAVSLEHL